MANKKVLIIEDDPGIRETIKEILEYAEFSVETAGNGRIGYDRASTQPFPHLILLDMSMPVLDGRGFLQLYLANSEINSIPVVMLSAFDLSSENLKGVSAYLRKPPDIDTLIGTVQRYVR